MKKKIESIVKRNTGYSLADFRRMETTNYEIKNIDIAVSIIKNAISKKQQITVVGDYDCDGICGTAIFKLALKKLGANFVTRLPKRFSEGYGLSPAIVDEINDGLLITVDNGIAAKEAISKAKAKGLTVLVTDHHLAPSDGIPTDADLIIDPNAIDDSADFCGYCGAGLAYRVCKELFNPNDAICKKFLTLACIATVADSVPLIEENRVIVQKGLSLMNDKTATTIGLYTLVEELDLIDYITEKDIGFKIGPCLNAPGRLQDNGAELSLDLVSFIGNKQIAIEKANRVIGFNEERKEKTETAMETFNQQIEDNALYGDGFLIIQNDNVSEGLVGLCAGKLAESEKRPTFVFGPFENGICKGSGRSYGGVHLKKCLDYINEKLPGVIVKYGGHSVAAGISVSEDRFTEFAQAMETMKVEIIEEPLNTDIEIYENEIENALKALAPFAPFGEGNPYIKFKVLNFEAMPQYGAMYKVLKEKHLKFSGKYTDAIWFSSVEKYEKMNKPTTFDVIGVFGENYFNGRITPTIEVSDIVPVSIKFSDTKLSNRLKMRAENI